MAKSSFLPKFRIHFRFRIITAIVIMRGRRKVRFKGGGHIAARNTKRYFNYFAAAVRVCKQYCISIHYSVCRGCIIYYLRS